MQTYRKALILTAIVGATALAGCAHEQPQQPMAAMVVVPSTPPVAVVEETRTVHTGTVVGVRDYAGPTSNQGSSGSSTQAGASSAGTQLLTIKYDDGRVRQFQITPTSTSQHFQVGDRVSVDNTQDTVYITH
jgi:outer membrane lipoprotein SlyB